MMPERQGLTNDWFGDYTSCVNTTKFQTSVKNLDWNWVLLTRQLFFSTKGTYRRMMEVDMHGTLFLGLVVQHHSWSLLRIPLKSYPNFSFVLPQIHPCICRMLAKWSELNVSTFSLVPNYSGEQILSHIVLFTHSGCF